MAPYAMKESPQGHAFDELTSWFQKALRRGQADEAIYAVLQLAANYEAYCWRRLKTIVTEDVGLADPDLMVRVQALHAAANELGKDPKQQANRLSHLVLATMLAARSPKSRIVDDALTLHMAEMDDPEQRREVPDAAVDRHTRRGRAQGKGWTEFLEEGCRLENEAPIENPYSERLRRHLLGNQLQLEPSEEASCA